MKHLCKILCGFASLRENVLAKVQSRKGFANFKRGIFYKNSVWDQNYAAAIGLVKQARMDLFTGHG